MIQRVECVMQGKSVKVKYAGGASEYAVKQQLCISCCPSIEHLLNKCSSK